MSENIRSTNLRFNLDKDVQNRAWQYLQTMDKKKFKSYSQIIAISLVDYFDRYYKKQDEPYLETREREERFVEQIVTAVENAMNRTVVQKPIIMPQTLILSGFAALMRNSGNEFLFAPGQQQYPK